MDDKSRSDLSRIEKLLESAHGIHRTVLLACAATVAVYYPKPQPFTNHCAAWHGIAATTAALQEIEASIEPDTAVQWVCVVSGQGGPMSIWQHGGQSRAWLHGVRSRAPLEIVLEDFESSHYVGVPTSIWDGEMELGEAALGRHMTTTFHALGIAVQADDVAARARSLVRRATLQRAFCSAADEITIEVVLDVREACAQLINGLDVSDLRCTGSESDCPKLVGLGLACLDHYGVPGAPQYLVIHERKLDEETLVERDVDDRVLAANQPGLQANITQSLELRSNPLFDLVRDQSPQHAAHVIENDWLEQQRRSASRDNVMVASIPLPNVTVISVLLTVLLAYLGVLVGEARRMVDAASEAVRGQFVGHHWIGISRGCVASWLFLISVAFAPFLAVCAGRVGNRVAEKITAGEWMELAKACRTPEDTWIEHAGWANDIGTVGWVLLVVSILTAVVCCKLWAALGHRPARKLLGPVCRLPQELLRLFGLRLLSAELRARFEQPKPSVSEDPEHEKHDQTRD